MPFPPEFLFGTANADHQVEAHDPAHEDVWDLWERSQRLMPRGRGTDFWNRYEEDIRAAAAMGCRMFRFSVAWSRVETSEGVFDLEALRHYREVADSIRRHGMKVMLTLHHFVWPVWLERDRGGLIGRQFPDLFARYADRVAKELGDRVDYWITFNEPSQLTFGYIKPWWQSRYYMPPGLPKGSSVDDEAAAVGKLVPGLFRAHARARAMIKARFPDAKVGANPLVTGFPTWLQMLMDWAACHRRLSEALFKFTSRRALVNEHAHVDLLLAGVTADQQTSFQCSDPYLRTGKAVMVKAGFSGEGIAALTSARVGVIGVGNQAVSWKRDLPTTCRKRVFRDYLAARQALDADEVDALYGDEAYLLPKELIGRERYRLLAKGLSDEWYVALTSPDQQALLQRINRAIGELSGERSHHHKPTPVSLAEVFRDDAATLMDRRQKRLLRRIQKRGILRVGIRQDAMGISPAAQEEGVELLLARRIAHEVMGDEKRLKIISVEPAKRLDGLKAKSGWLNWAWRFWGTTSLIANASWWYLGISGRLPVELCPEEALGAQDFVGLDYYWGLPTRKLHKFRSLEEAARGKFIHAPVWPRGLFHALKRFHRWFPKQELIVVENGSVPVASGISRTDYLRAHLKEVEKAIDAGVPVRGFNLWSITSNREWGHAFDPNTDFGLYFVDLDKDPELNRVATPEVEIYSGIIAARTVGK